MPERDRTDRKLLKKRSGVKRFLPQTLFFRSLLILVTPVLLIQIILTVVFFDRHWSHMTSRLAHAVAGEIALVVYYIDHEKSQDETEQLIALLSRKLDLLMTYDDGETLLPDDTHADLSGFFVGWKQMIERTLRYELGKVLPGAFTVNVDFSERWVEVRAETVHGILNVQVPQRRLFSSTTYIFLLWVFGASAVLLVISVLFMRNQIRPIRRLAIAAEHFGKGRDVRDFKIEGAREVRQAGQAFLDMKTRIQRQVSQRTEMLAGVSHDLRTPLTRLKLQISMMGDSPDVYAMKKDIHEMEKMIEGYLSFVRGEGREKSQLVALDALIGDIAVSAKRLGLDCDVQIVPRDGSYSVMLREGAFRRCLMNIAGNAARYAGHIWVTLRAHDARTVEIVIEDDGPGIEEDQYDAVFRPFYRVDEARNMDAGAGVGLGLPIAMDIVHAHGGEIRLDRSTHGGLAVHIILPV